ALRSFADTSADQMMLGPEAEALRWFLLPSEARQQLLQTGDPAQPSAIPVIATVMNGNASGTETNGNVSCVTTNGNASGMATNGNASGMSTNTDAADTATNDNSSALNNERKSLAASALLGHVSEATVEPSNDFIDAPSTQYTQPIIPHLNGPQPIILHLNDPQPDIPPPCGPKAPFHPVSYPLSKEEAGKRADFVWQQPARLHYWPPPCGCSVPHNEHDAEGDTEILGAFLDGKQRENRHPVSGLQRENRHPVSGLQR
ncbi:uncharacterized protein LOC108679066, partial [Hyalella azteca]|uniref:Uncharacterized protein LOC108679066 n=1 Tax=Hyalella azteca TaxID=294128 RepID=A0A8B7PBJ7_HYAAZ